jgi:hypothetical protein
MSLLTNLDETFSHAEDLNAIDKLMSFVDPELLQQAYELSGVATVRRRRLPLDSVVLTIVGMSLFRNDPVWDIANKLNVSLPGKNRFVAPSAVVQARQRLSDDAVGHVFKLMAQRAFTEYAFEQWCGLNVLAVDGVMFRAQDTAENLDAFGCDRNAKGDNPYPQVRMCSLMETSSHLLLASEFDSRDVGEMSLAQRLVPSVPDNTLTLFDRGYYSQGLLYLWMTKGVNTHWILPARKDLQYTVRHQLSEDDAVITLKTSPQARKKFDGLPETIEARLTRYKVDGKSYRVLSSMVDAMQFPYEEVVNVYVQRWEIELGFREMKQTLHQAKLTLRSKKPEMVRQELWGLLVAYNLIRMMMLDAVKDMPELSPSRLSFGLCMRNIIVFFLNTLPETVTKLPAHYEYLMESLTMMRLPDKRPDRYYPRVVRKRPTKYPTKKNASQLN